MLPLAAVSAETIYYASGDLLSSMASSRGLSTDGSESDIRSRLYAYYGYEEASVSPAVSPSDDNDEGESYTLTIKNAETVTSTEGVVTLKGNVSIDFNFSDQAAKTLTASTVIVDSSKAVLTAIGGAVYTDSAADAAIKEIEADILTVKWEKMDIFLTGGSTNTERENSEKKKVTFSTSGERLSYLSEGAVVFDEGYITSNPKTAYSSISASSILILPGEDMFLSSATFNIGRVPIFYLPFFFFPGSRILGNPSFGFSSDKGAFVNTTFELIGSYPKIESTEEDSSFSSLLKSTSGNENVSPDGYYYSETEEKSSLATFARNTSSYLAVLVDAYKGGEDASILKKGGMHIGVDSLFNLFNKTLKISFSAGVATPLSTEKKTLRYYGNGSLSYSAKGLSAELKFPFYSDSTVLYHYGNRLTGFSYGPLLGGKSTFPTDYSSSGITSFTRILRLSYSLPSSVKIPLVSSFSIKNLSIEENWSLSSSTSKSVLSSYSLPSLSVSLSGTVFSFETKTKSKETAEEETKTEQTHPEKDESVKEGETEEEVKEEERVDILLISPYEKKSAETQSTSSSSSTTGSKLSLSYTLTEDFSRKINNNTATEKKKDGKTTSTFYSRLTAEGNVGTIITFSNVFTNSLGYTDTSDYVNSSWTKKLVSTPLDTLKISVPYIGLTYNLSLKPFDYTEEEKKGSEKSVTSSSFEFTKDFVKTHSLSLGKSLSTTAGTFSADISYILPPLEGSITPSLKWSGWGVTTTLSLLFKEDGDSFRSDKLKADATWSWTYINFSSSLAYQTKDYDKDDFWMPFTLSSTLRIKSPDSKYYAEGKITGDGSKDGFLSSATATLKMDEVTAVLNFTNTDAALVFDSVNIRTSLSSKSFQLWKGRFYCAFALDSTLFLSHTDRSRSYFTITPQVTLSLAEFADVKFSFKSQNNKLGSYYDDSVFSFREMWSDLMRSFDFFGDGRRNTNFVLQSVSVDVVHYMEDWNLNFSYSTSFRKSTAGGKTIYTLQPSFSVYLAWNTMPDLKVDEKWTKENGSTWTRK